MFVCSQMFYQFFDFFLLHILPRWHNHIQNLTNLILFYRNTLNFHSGSCHWRSHDSKSWYFSTLSSISTDFSYDFDSSPDFLIWLFGTVSSNNNGFDIHLHLFFQFYSVFLWTSVILWHFSSRLQPTKFDHDWVVYCYLFFRLQYNIFA